MVDDYDLAIAAPDSAHNCSRFVFSRTTFDSALYVALLNYLNFPRPLTDQTVSTMPLRTPYIASCRKTVASP